MVISQAFKRFRQDVETWKLEDTDADQPVVASAVPSTGARPARAAPGGAKTSARDIDDVWQFASGSARLRTPRTESGRIIEGGGTLRSDAPPTGSGTRRSSAVEQRGTSRREEAHGT